MFLSLGDVSMDPELNRGMVDSEPQDEGVLDSRQRAEWASD